MASRSPSQPQSDVNKTGPVTRKEDMNTESTIATITSSMPISQPSPVYVVTFFIPLCLLTNVKAVDNGTRILRRDVSIVITSTEICKC